MKNWIAGATSAHKGALRKSLGAKPGQPIPAATLEHAEHSKDPKTAERARLAVTLRSLSKGR